MKKNVTCVATFLGVASFCATALCGSPAEAQPRRGRAEIVGWAANGKVVVFSEPQKQKRKRTVNLVARKVPSGEIIRSQKVHPGPCTKVIDKRVAIAHACALARLRKRLPKVLQKLQFHVAANERGRISRLSLRADGSIVEHELPGLGLVLRGRTEQEDGQPNFGVLEVNLMGKKGGRVIERRPMRPKARRHWTLLKAGKRHIIVVGPGLLHRISPPRPSKAAQSGPNKSS